MHLTKMTSLATYLLLLGVAVPAVWLRIQPAVSGPDTSTRSVYATESQVTTVNINVGKAFARSVATRDFVVENTSSVEWHVDRILTACGCANAQVQTRIVPPSSFLRGNITVRLPDRQGAFSTHATITFKAITQEVKVRVGALVESGIVLSPPSMQIDARASDLTTLRATVAVTSRFPLATMTVTNLPSWCTVESLSEPTADETGSYERHVALVFNKDELLKFRTNHAVLSVGIDDDRLMPARLRLTVSIDPPLKIQPSQLFFSRMCPHVPSTLAVVVTAAGYTDSMGAPQLRIPASLVGHLDAQVQVIKDGHFLVTATLTLDESLAVVDDIMTVNYGPDSVAIPLNARVRKCDTATESPEL